MTRRLILTGAVATCLAAVVTAMAPLNSTVALANASDPHAYFDALIKRADIFRHFSLRDPKQLTHPKNGGYAHSNTRPLVVSYDPSNDPDPRRQDAAKVLIPAGQESLTNQIRVPINNGNDGFLITWDSWMGKEFAYANSKIGGYKHFQLSSGGELWTEVRSRFDIAHNHFPDFTAMVDIRVYKTAGQTRTSKIGTISYGTDSLGGQLSHFPIAPDTWTRYWVWIRPRPNDSTWWDLSMWMADETRDAVQLFDKAGVRPNPEAAGKGWGSFWLEYNTSSSSKDLARGDLTAYARNIVMLRGLTDVSGLLLRPNAGTPPPGPTNVLLAPRNLRLAANP